MQAEILEGNAASKIRIVGVNETGLEGGNGLVVSGRTLPWLQDDAVADVWTSWDVTFRDVIVVDEENRPVAVYNLTTNDLGSPAKYAELLAILKAAAGE
jgi:hypothetical protein